MKELTSIIEHINQALEAKSQVRDRTLTRSRELIRACANTIRAVHRQEFETAETLLQAAQDTAEEMIDDAKTYPDVYYAGYTQDALKEFTEANLTRSIVLEQTLPSPQELKVEYAAYLNGLAETGGELRRFALDALRRGDVPEAERMLGRMEDIYSLLVTVDFPSGITGNLRRNTDMVRGVLHRTRGDVTTAVRQETMKMALKTLEKKLDLQN
ncbi:haloacid dehalogenase [Anaerolineales bacterium HSG24]|nr:haloacid dehalogenase [Anaerolineales bacterium HSG24]